MNELSAELYSITRTEHSITMQCISSTGIDLWGCIIHFFPNMEVYCTCRLPWVKAVNTYGDVALCGKRKGLFHQKSAWIVLLLQLLNNLTYDILFLV